MKLLHSLTLLAIVGTLLSLTYAADFDDRIEQDSPKVSLASKSSAATGLDLSADRVEELIEGKSARSYIAYPVKQILYQTYNLIDFVTKNPTLMTSLLLAAQFQAAAADAADNSIKLSLFGYNLIELGFPCTRIGEIKGWFSFFSMCPNRD